MAKRERRRESPGRRAAEARVARRSAGTPPSRSEQGSERPSRSHDARSELLAHPFVRCGFYAWAFVGFVVCALVLLFVVAQLRFVVVPTVLALFPAALLAGPAARLRERGVPPSLAALAVLLGGLAVLVFVGQFIVARALDEAPMLGASIRQGWEDLQAFIETGPFGTDPQAIRDTLESIQQQVTESDLLRTGVLGAAGAVAEMVAMLLLLLVVLFFFLKDGQRIAAWLRDLFPSRMRHDVHAVGERAWTTITGYIRGQLLIALADAVFIGIGLALLGVTLALPLGVIVFFGGLFPIVGAVVTGALAVLVALADGGPVIALIALGIVIGVQQLESNVLAPLVLGKATALHPLAVLVSLTAGGILLGVLGAFIAVPIAASFARAMGYLRRRDALA